MNVADYHMGINEDFVYLNLESPIMESHETLARLFSAPWCGQVYTEKRFNPDAQNNLTYIVMVAVEQGDLAAVIATVRRAAEYLGQQAIAMIYSTKNVHVCALVGTNVSTWTPFNLEYFHLEGEALA